MTFYETLPIRTFVAFKLPENIISAIRQVQDEIIAYRFKAKWVQPAKIHLTIKFLGDTSTDAIAKIGEAIQCSAKACPPIELCAKGIGVFPGINRARVVWVGIKGETDLLRKLQESLQNELSQIGFARERRSFKGHLTLGRLNKSPDPNVLLKAIEELEGFESEPFTADRVILFKSDLKPEGAVYSEVMSVKLN